MEIQVIKRSQQPLALPWILLLSVAPSFFIGALIFAAAGAGPLEAYGHMLRGAFGSGFHFSEVVVKSIPLIFTGLAVTLAARMLLWNIGCEGQLVAGGILAAGVGLYLAPQLPDRMVLPVLIAAGFTGGALWALGPAVLKSRWRVNW